MVDPDLVRELTVNSVVAETIVVIAIVREEEVVATEARDVQAKDEVEKTAVVVGCNVVRFENPTGVVLKVDKIVGISFGTVVLEDGVVVYLFVDVGVEAPIFMVVVLVGQGVDVLSEDLHEEMVIVEAVVV